MVQKGLFFLILFSMALASCGPGQTVKQTVCVDFESPLTVGTQYGAPAGQSPGDVAFTSNAVSAILRDFLSTGGGAAFNLIEIDTAPVSFGNGQSLRLNNLNVEFDFSQVGFQVAEVTVEFLDLGGHENLSINGNPSPAYAGEFNAAPNPIGGITLVVATTPVTGGTQGTMTLTGQVTTVEIGGQELWIDNVCASE
jgi:hypothetical protein